MDNMQQAEGWKQLTLSFSCAASEQSHAHLTQQDGRVAACNPNSPGMCRALTLFQELQIPAPPFMLRVLPSQQVVIVVLWSPRQIFPGPAPCWVLCWTPAGAEARALPPRSSQLAVRG